jgi:hypothetical protein
MFLLVALIAWAWSYLAPLYNQLLVTLAGPLTPASVVLEATADHEITIRYTPPTLLGDPWISISTLILQGGPLLLSAMVLVTPRLALARRGLGLAAMGSAFLCLHILVVSFQAWTLRWSVDGRAVNLDTTLALEPLFYFVVPALVAGAWCLRFWLSALREA